jgi:Tol biopolymer transport system component
MSPEQALGEKTDRRTDLWSLGVVLYQMITGRLPFEAERQEAVLYGILNEEPEPVTARRAGLPLELERIVGKALAKDREERYQHAEDLLVDLRSLLKKLASGKTNSVSGRARPTQLGHPIASDRDLAKPHSFSKTLLAAVALLALTSAVLAVLWLRSSVPAAELPHRTFAISTESPAFWPSISPDGRYVTYITKTSALEPRLWVHELSQDEPRALAGPEQEVWNIKPFWSPDSRFILFRAGQQLRRISVLGGAAVTVCEQLPNLTVGPWGGAYSPDGASIVMGFVGGLFEAPAQGGVSQKLIEQPPGGRLLWPHFLPGEEGSRKLLYVRVDQRMQGQIVAHDLKSGQREILVSGFLPVYDPSGHIIYSVGDPPEVWSVPFSIDTLKMTGDPFPVRKNASLASVAADGTLLYQEGGMALIDEPVQLVWRDRKGKTLGSIGQPQNVIRSPALSPDEKRVATQSVETYGFAIWIHEVDRPVKTRLTSATLQVSENWEMGPTWSPEGDRLAFSTERPRNVFVRRSDGTGEPVQLTDSDTTNYLSQWSSDGKILFFERGEAEGGQLTVTGDLWYLKKRDDGEEYEEVPFLQTPSDEIMPSLSPDGRVVAYVSDESGQEEVYLRTFPGGGGKRSVSPSGGRQPRWRADGKELFYVQGRNLMAVSVAAAPSLKLGAPEPLFSSEGLPSTAALRMCYDVSRDGQRFVLAEPAEQGSRTLRVVQNWFAEFRDRQQD